MNFSAPEMLLALAVLPIIWLLLRLIPPKPTKEMFGGTAILLKLAEAKQTPHKTPWWIILLRLLIATCCILAIANPLYNPSQKIINAKGEMLVVLDDRWSTAQDWDERKLVMTGVVEEATQNGNLITLVKASEDVSGEPMRPEEVGEIINAAEPMPVNSSVEHIVRTIEQGGYETIIWFADGIQSEGNSRIAEAINQAGVESIVYSSDNPDVTVISQVRNQGDALIAEIVRSTKRRGEGGIVAAYDIKGRPVATESFEFEGDAQVTEVRFDNPIELRNEFVRLAIQDADNAGAVQLLDDRFRRRRVGVISGENADRAQPLLSPVYYVERAIRPFSEVRTPKTSNPIVAIDELIDERVDIIILADIGTLQEQSKNTLQKWVEGGGTLVRFAGPRLAGVDNQTLVPVKLRGGERSLVGTLTWSTPQKLARFNPNSPFAEIEIPDDVEVSRQVLAEPQIDLADKTWAGLYDGTPLVTASRQGLGRIVLFHVTADTAWSNLPLSGTFVDMLKAINFTATSFERRQLEETAQALVPLKTLNGYGELGNPMTDTKPLSAEVTQPTNDNPPGLYGSQTAFVALNLFGGTQKIEPFDSMDVSFPDNPNVQVKGYDIVQPYSFKPWLLIAAILLFIVDGLARLILAGGFTKTVRMTPKIATIVLGVFLVGQPNADAQESVANFEAALDTRLAYVVTGDSVIDEISRKGIGGLTNFLTRYTAIEPAPPHGINVGQDELSFYPLIYWPVSTTANIPDSRTMARIDAYMKKGGTVIFDTRDYIAGPNAQETLRLREMLRHLDIPPLEPVPNDHVLTRTFFLLDTFPGRYRDGPLWVEKSTKQENRLTRRGDGVSSIIITANDLAGAWATEPSGLPTLPTIPNHPRQRELAFRVGVNIVMYTLTGNYKADQVHAPEILRRLGQ